MSCIHEVSIRATQHVQYVSKTCQGNGDLSIATLSSITTQLAVLCLRENIFIIVLNYK